MDFDQLIMEYFDKDDPAGGWVHISYHESGSNRKQVLTLMVKNTAKDFQIWNGKVEKLSDRKIFADIIKKAKMVDGICPHCEEHSLLIGIVNDYYRCMSCGGDIEQKVNGKISYLPIQLKEYDEVKDNG